MNTSLSNLRRKPQRNILELMDDKRVLAGLNHVFAGAGNSLQRTLTSPSFQRAISITMAALKATPKLQEADPKSALGVIMLSMLYDLPLNTTLGQAYALPFEVTRWIDDKKITVMEAQFVFGYGGLITLAERAPAIRPPRNDIVFEGDQFEFIQGTETKLTHTWSHDKSISPREVPIRAWSVIDRIDGSQDVLVMEWDEILKARDQSPSYRSAVKKLNEAIASGKQSDINYRQAMLKQTVWERYQRWMGRKTIIKRHIQYQSLEDDRQGNTKLMSAARVDDAGEQGRLKLSAFADPEYAAAVGFGEADITWEDPPELEQEKPERLQKPQRSRRRLYDQPKEPTEPKSETPNDPSHPSESSEPASNSPEDLGFNAPSAQPESQPESQPKRGRGRPKLTDEEKKERKRAAPKGAKYPITFPNETETELYVANSWPSTFASVINGTRMRKDHGFLQEMLKANRAIYQKLAEQHGKEFMAVLDAELLAGDPLYVSYMKGDSDTLPDLQSSQESVA